MTKELDETVGQEHNLLQTVIERKLVGHIYRMSNCRRQRILHCRTRTKKDVRWESG